MKTKLDLNLLCRTLFDFSQNSLQYQLGRNLKREEIETLIKKVMFKPKKQQFTVEQIHAEFDSGEERILAECNKILSNLNVPTETQVERKASLLLDLGFVNSETIKQAEKYFQRRKETEQKLVITQKQADLIKYYKQKYPLEKFITVDELDRICEKYSLIYAPVNNYIKDVPEKNLYEIKNRKKLDIEDQTENLYKLSRSGHKKKDFQKFLNFIGKPDGIIKENEHHELIEKFTQGEYKKSYWPIEDNTWAYVIWNLNERERTGYYEFNQIEKVNKSELFIAAPKSHFNLKNLKKEFKFRFLKYEKLEVKDPVVFEFCKNNIVRIITKWGTEDDQSYLDPSLINEILN